MAIEDGVIRRVPVCDDCRQKSQPGSEPSCTFEKDVLTLIDQLQDGIVQSQDGRSRLSVLSQSARQKGCPNIATVRRNLDHVVDPKLTNRSPFFYGGANGSTLPYEGDEFVPSNLLRRSPRS